MSFFFFIEHHVHLAMSHWGGVGDRGIKGEADDQMSAESSGMENSKDGWDGLGHQVSIICLPNTTIPLLKHPLSPPRGFSRQHDLQKTNHSSRPATFAKKTKTDAGQPRGNPPLSHVSSLSFPPEQDLRLVMTQCLLIPWQSNI